MLRRFATVGFLLSLGCGQDSKGVAYTIAGTYTVRTSWRDGQFGGEPAAITLSDDGRATRYGPSCPEPLFVTDALRWEVDASSVVLYLEEDRSVFARLELSAEICGEHEYYPDDSDRSTTYVSGRYCAVDVVDNGHAGYVCGGWEPCDEVAAGCVETFDREYGG